MTLVHFIPRPLGIARKFIGAIILFSTLLTLIASALQLYIDYTKDVRAIRQQLVAIETSHLPSLIDNLWKFDDQGIKSQLEGILALPMIESLRVERRDAADLFVGRNKGRHLITHTVPLSCTHREKTIPLGALHITACSDGAFERLKERGLVILATQFVLIFFVSAFIYVLFYYLIGRHLKAIVSHTAARNSTNLESQLSLQRIAGKAGEEDELDQMVTAINAMQSQISRDIAERKQAGDELKRSEDALKRQNSLLSSLLKILPIGVFMVEAPSGKLLVANDAAYRVLGRGILPDVSDQNLSEVYKAFKMGSRDPYPLEEMPLLLGMSGKTSHVDDMEIERPDGTKTLLEIFGSPVTDDQGQVWASVVSFIDITDRKGHEEERLKIEKLESLGVLAGGIAHDFNNILTGIIGNISFAQRFLDATHRSYKPLLEAEKASVRAGELAHQLLTFARGGAPVKKVISLRHIVSECVSLVLHGSNVKAATDIPDSIDAIEADEGQMSQVFHNIIINATQAMPGGGTLTVTAQNEMLDDSNTLSMPPGRYVRLTFTDQGCGIADNDLKRIFDPYFTTKLTGSGLGLASVNSIINRHGGHVGVSSIIGTGTTFTIHLPSIGESYSKYQTDTAAVTTGEHNGGTVLVMDDEAMIRDMISDMLACLGYQVTVSENGAEAVSLYQTALESGTPFSVVLMDLTIPGGMGGKEAAALILAIDPKARLIVSSGYSNDPIMSDYRTYGFCAAVAKPYNMKMLGQQLSAVLSQP